jgi:hypothetical protein
LSRLSDSPLPDSILGEDGLEARVSLPWAVAHAVVLLYAPEGVFDDRATARSGPRLLGQARPDNARELRDQMNSCSCLADDPLTAVVMGAGKVLDELSLLRDISVD